MSYDEYLESGLAAGTYHLNCQVNEAKFLFPETQARRIPVTKGWIHSLGF